jgi:hypothetical protein
MTDYLEFAVISVFPGGLTLLSCRSASTSSNPLL